MRLRRSYWTAALLSALAHPAGAVSADPPTHWTAPLPAERSLADLRAWWSQFDDPLVARLVDAAQAASPDLAAAVARIETARAAGVAAGAALGPTLDAVAQAQRGRPDLSSPTFSSASIGAQASWEIDVFGAGRARRAAAEARLEGAQAQWHDARTLVAAEVALAYLGLRSCEAQLEQVVQDTQSRSDTERLMTASARAGFQAPADAALAQASAAQARAQQVALQAQCEQAHQGLVALTAWSEAELRQAVSARRAQLPRPMALHVADVPAQALAQRPDVRAAAVAVQAAASEVSAAEAAHWPTIRLNGVIGRSHLDTGSRISGTTWTLGPISITLPVWDGGVRRADEAAARAAYDAAVSAYGARIRQALREVEEALIGLDAAARRVEAVRAAADGFERAWVATQARQRVGMASLFELEDARRSWLAARRAVIDLERERITAWISLYRALGGGWAAPNDSMKESAA